jgi:hypothetical protein
MKYNEMVCERNINVQSNCEHHFVIIDGKLSQSVGQNKEGASVTYNNVSASTVFRFDGAGSNPSPATTPVGAPAATGDDFPF